MKQGKIPKEVSGKRVMKKKIINIEIEVRPNQKRGGGRGGRGESRDPSRAPDKERAGAMDFVASTLRDKRNGLEDVFPYPRGGRKEGGGEKRARVKILTLQLSYPHRVYIGMKFPSQFGDKG
jgi:hypothetical protein